METQTATEIIEALATKLSVPVEQVFSMVQGVGVKDVVITILAFVATLFFMLVSFYLFSVYNSLTKKDGEDSNILVTSVLITIASFVFFCFSLADTVLWLFARESWAMKYILDYIARTRL